MVSRNTSLTISTPRYEVHTSFNRIRVYKVKNDLAMVLFNKKRNRMKETLEEAAERLYPTDYGVKSKDIINIIKQDAFINGAKWQQEQILDFLYSEITERRDYSASKMCEKVIEFIEQFKKK